MSSSGGCNSDPRRPRGAAARLGALLACLAAGGCAWTPRPQPDPVAVVPVEVTTTYFAARVPGFARGEFAIVEVCVEPDGSIAGTRIAQTSTDRAFDSAALDWARRAHYRPQLVNGRAVYGCEQVRVEINPNPGPRIATGSDSALG